jgi:outer membrane protein assembly factor BamB
MPMKLWSAAGSFKPVALIAVITIALVLGPKEDAGARAGMSTYTNPTFSVSFQYPSDYILKTGRQAKLNWGYLGPVRSNFLHAGGLPVAAVKMPDDSYRGTDFVIGFLLVSVNSALDDSECAQFDRPNPYPKLEPPWFSTAKVGAIEFAETEYGDAASSHQASAKDYHVYRNRACYEFLLGLGTAGFGAAPGLRKVDDDEVFRKLTAILATVKFSPVTIAAPSSPIRSFAITLMKSATPITYRVAWDVPSAPANVLQIKSDCGHWQPRLWRTAEGDKTESPLKCGEPISLQSNKGTFLLRVSSNDWGDLALTLRVQGKHARSRTRTLMVPPSPSIEMMLGGECGISNNGPVMAGHEFTIFGNGFVAKGNTVRIGPVKLTTASSDCGQEITVLLPASAPPGNYRLSVENELGKSAAFPVVVVPPAPPQNVKPGRPIANHPIENPQLAKAPWPMLGHDLQHSGRSPERAIPNPGTLRWKFTTAGPISSAPIVGADGTIYVASSDNNLYGHLYAIDPSGVQKWRFKTCSHISSSPAITGDGTIYVESEDGNLYAINSEDGTQWWKFSIGGGTEISSPTVGADGTIYTVCDGGLCAIHPDGTPKWTFTTIVGSAPQGAPAIDRNGTIYVGAVHCKEQTVVCWGDLYAINPDGTQRWKFTTAGYVESGPVIGPDGTIYVVDNERDETTAWLPSRLYAVNPEGRLKWKFSAGKRAFDNSAPALGPDGTIYFASSDCNFYALNSDGTRKWTFKLCPYRYSIPFPSPPTVAGDGAIYVNDGHDKLYAITPDGTPKWTYATSASSSVKFPTSVAIGASGTIYLGSSDGLYAIGRSLSATALNPKPAPPLRR